MTARLLSHNMQSTKEIGKSGPRISVVIGTLNQRDVLERVLESFARQTAAAADFEVIVVDSSSSDGTDALMKSFKTPYSLRYIRQENRGKSGARNRGVREAVSPLILLTDADMVAEENLVATHLQGAAQFPDSTFEGLTYNLRSIALGEKDSSNRIPYITRKLRPFQKLDFYYFLTGKLSAPKAVLEKAGLFDEEFTGYGWEDLELGYRLKKMGIPLRYLPTAINFHFHPLDAQHAPEKKFSMGESAAYFHQKHPEKKLKYFLGAHPVPMAIYHFIAQQPAWEKWIKEKAEREGLWRWAYQEYLYRKGFEEGLGHS